jgi:hypothetical protein
MSRDAFEPASRLETDETRSGVRVSIAPGRDVSRENELFAAVAPAAELPGDR